MWKLLRKCLGVNSLDKVLPNILTVKYYRSIDFDGGESGSSEATGFVVDDKAGYILTNKHVTGTGPWRSRAIFDNHEECDLHRVHVDPIHDFAILGFNPASVKGIDFTAIPLRPDLARVGENIQVIGNDAGQKLSILLGVISRVDRPAPKYAKGYRDFDTSYIQASINGSGGSSGSPVLAFGKFAVALQCGGLDDAETDYFLPLDRPLHVLRCLQAGRPISRGTLQCSWIWKSFKDCEGLGLTDDLKKEITDKFPHEMGMLVAETVLPEGPSDGKIKEGDVLIRINGQILTKFPLLDEILDSSVGESVSLVLQRGPETVRVAIDVEDLHKITPSRYISAAGSTFHDLSFQTAHAYNRPCKGVFVSGAVGSFKDISGCIVLKIDDKDTPDLDHFQAVIKSIPDRARIVVRYMSLQDQNIDEIIIRVDYYWTGPMVLAARQGYSDIWDKTIFAEPLPPTLPASLSGSFSIPETLRYPGEEEILQSRITVSFTTPIQLDGALFSETSGSGTILDAGTGYAIISSSVVFQDLGNVSITIADSIVIDGEVVLIHQQENYAIIKFNPALVLAPIRSAKLSNDRIKPGARVFFVGTRGKKSHVDETTVAEVDLMNIELNPARPRYRAVNLDALDIPSYLGGQCPGGLLVAGDTVLAFWLRYIAADTSEGYNVCHRGLGSATVIPVIEDLRRGVIPQLRLLDVEFSVLAMSDARTYKVPEHWIQKVESQASSSRKLFRVKKLAARLARGQETLLEGDVLLTLNDELITWFSELNNMQCHEVLDARIVRSGAEMVLQVPTISANDLQTDKFVKFCGAVIQKPHFAVKQQMRNLPSEVYVSGIDLGSPADHYGLPKPCFITAVNYVPTLDIEKFRHEAEKIPDNSHFTLRVVRIEGVPLLPISMRKHEQDFPSEVWTKDPQHPRGWVKG